ncbi:MAG: vitamin K epoxide reductase family protein [Acidobacteriota bacterium]
MTSTVRRIVLLFALAGLAASVSSLYVHHQMLQQVGYLSFCDVSETVSCTTVYQSRYSAVWGVPVALLGALWFVSILLLLAGSLWGPAGLRENSIGYVFAWSTAGLGVSLYLAYASFFIIKAVCLMCLATYVAVAGIFLTAGARTTFSMRTLPRRLVQDTRAMLASPALLTVLILFIMTASAAMAFYPRVDAGAPVAGDARAQAAGQDGTAGQPAGFRASEFLRYWESQPRVQVPVPNDGAAVLVVKFTDHQCPSCAQTYLDYKPILAKYRAQFPGAVKFVAKDYPLEDECNSSVNRAMHPAACEAAVATRMARLAGREELMEDWLYTNSATLTPMSVRQAALDIGRVKDFDAQYPTVLNQVKTDIALAQILNITVTPTFFINGVRLDGGLPAQYFDMALQYELKRAGKQ